jgi:hypothetical protein
METYALTIIAQLNQGNYKSLGIHPIIDGMKSRVLDKNDGQVYEVIVRPTGIMLSPEAIEAFKKGHEIKCECCEEILTDSEIIEGTGYCQYCYLQSVKETNEEQKHPDNNGN